jgi:hypothetical protein
MRRLSIVLALLATGSGACGPNEDGVDVDARRYDGTIVPDARLFDAPPTVDAPPLVNAARPPGQWQSYDVIFTRPRFNEKGELVSPARMTVLHNGVLVQNNVSLWGGTAWMSHAGYRPHSDKLPLSLQDHGNPVRFRNIWVRDLEGGPAEFTYSTNVLERLVGTYEVNKDTAIVVTRKEAQLTMSVVHPGREHSYALFAGSPTEFFAKSVDSDLAFQINTGGAVEGLKFRMAGETRPAKKVK